MGDVYRALDTTTGSHVAVKVLKEQARNVDRARFKREAHILADLRHPGVVRCLDYGQTDGGRLFLVMDWLHGEDLARLLTRRPVGLADATELVRRVAQALAAVHSRGIVHRDLKPSNIFLEVKGGTTTLKLIDFGLVKVPDPDDCDTQVGTLLGTPWFMAPEQAMGKEVDATADVYSLGAVLFRLATGINAFDTRNLVAYLNQLMRDEAPLLSSIRRDVPPELDALVASMLRRSPQKRPANAGDLARLLARLPAMANGVPTHTPTPRPRLAQPVGSETPAPLTFADLLLSQSTESAAAGVQRVVTMLIISAPPGTLPVDAAGRVRPLLGDDARYEMFRQGDLAVVMGLVRTTGDEAVCAARAALRLARLAPQARIVLATGFGIVGPTGLDGEVVVRAASMIDRIKTPGILVDEPTLSLIGDRFATRNLDGGAALIHEHPADVRPLQGTSLPLIGRTRELEAMLGMLDEVVGDGLPRGCLVVGSKGVGKSRLRKEFDQQVASTMPGVEILTVRAEPRLRRPGLPDLGRALRERIGIRDGQATAAQAMKLVRYLADRGSFPDHALEFLGELVGMEPSEDTRALRSIPPGGQKTASRLCFAYEALLRLNADRTPHVLILEDFDQIDAVSVEIAGWILACKDLPVAVFAFAHPSVEQRFPSLWADKRSTRLRLGPMPNAACNHLVDNVLPTITPAERTSLVERAGGNPLILENLARHHDASTGLPIAAHASLQAQLDTLPQSTQQAVRAASVFGWTFWTEGVDRLLDRPCTTDVAALYEAGWVTQEAESTVPGLAAWRFRPAFIAETAYASLPENDRTALHHRAWQWLVAVGAQDPSTIASHAESAGDRGSAALQHAKASEDCYAQGLLAQALEFAVRATACADTAPSQVQGWLLQAKSLQWMGRLDELRKAAKTASTLALPGSEAQAEARRMEAIALREDGRAMDGDLLLASTLQSPKSAQLHHATRSLLLAEWARTLVSLGRAREGSEAAEEAAREAEASGEAGRDAMVDALDAQGIALSFLGDYSAAIEAARRTAERAEDLGAAYLSTRARIHLGFVLVRIGLLEEGRAELELALADTRLLGMQADEGFALHYLGRVLARSGALDTAIEHHALAGQIGEETHHHRLTLIARIHEAMALAERGGAEDSGRASLLAELARAEASLHPSAEAEAALAQALVDRAEGKFEAASERCSEAMGLLGIVGTMEEGEERLRLARAELLIGLGRESEGDTATREAYDCVVERSRRMADEGHREAYLTRVAECRRIVELASERLSLGWPVGS